MIVKTRFAPSPTGVLHVGNLRTAIHNWLFARRHGGQFWLRIDDTDRARSREEYVDAIRADLDWLGMTPDGEVRQSDRFDRYDAVFEQLRAAGRVYPCYETPEELEIRRKVLLSRGLPPVYERTALTLTDADHAAKAAAGIAPHWRFRLDHDRPIAWTDLVRGDQHFDPSRLSDPVVRRADGSWLYLLPSVIDDIDMAITHVVRGEDHVSNTAVQMQMFAALGAAPPVFAHEALLVGADGKLSKRLGATGIADLRADGVEPIALLALLARLGTSAPVEPVTDTAPLIAGIDFATFGRAPARYDADDLVLLNAKILHRTDHAAVADRLPAAIDAARWDAIRGNIDRVDDAADWVAVFEGPLGTLPADPADQPVIAAALAALPTVEWTADPWHTLTNAVKAATGAKGRALFLPLRRALTARDAGPDMAAVLPLIARDQAESRLRSAQD